MDNAPSPKFLDEITTNARNAALELCIAARLEKHQIVVVGCSTSEIAGRRIGTGSNEEIGAAVFDALYGVFAERDIYVAAQCCEHLNRAIIIECEAADGYETVNVVPAPEAGGAFASAAYRGLHAPVALESIRADAGLDIGGTLIGMHLKAVAIPLRLATTSIGKASIIAARTRPKLIGGARARYDDSLF